MQAALREVLPVGASQLQPSPWGGCCADAFTSFQGWLSCLSLLCMPQQVLGISKRNMGFCRVRWAKGCSLCVERTLDASTLRRGSLVYCCVHGWYRSDGQQPTLPRSVLYTQNIRRLCGAQHRFRHCTRRTGCSHQLATLRRLPVAIGYSTA